MKSKINDRKIKLLLHKLGYLRLEIEVKSEELSQHEQKFNESYYSSFVEEDETNIEKNDDVSPPQHVPPPVNVEEGQSASAEEKVDEFIPVLPEEEKEPEDLKKIWKQIAMATHPDKTGNDPEMMEVYKKASDAYKNKRYDEIIEIALSLSIDLSFVSMDVAEILERRTAELEKKLKELQGNVLWDWASGDEAKRTKIEKVLNSYRKKKKKRR